jgi:tight adherence protein B
VTAWVIAGCLVACVVAAVWPAATARRRLAGGPLVPGSARFAVDFDELRGSARLLAARSPRRLIALVAGGSAAASWLAGGPVAAFVGAVYCALLTGAALRRTARREAALARAGSLDNLAALGADLRAGLPPASAADRLPKAETPTSGRSQYAVRAERRIADLTDAVWRLAEQTGAPAADLVERIEADSRAADRAKASAAAQAAGAQATALLLAALPLAGIGLGYMIGADPLRVLLHTPLGGVCAAAAVVLQCAGMLWADRLANGPAQ